MWLQALMDGTATDGTSLLVVHNRISHPLGEAILRGVHDSFSLYNDCLFVPEGSHRPWQSLNLPFLLETETRQQLSKLVTLDADECLEGMLLVLSILSLESDAAV